MRKLVLSSFIMIPAFICGIIVELITYSFKQGRRKAKGTTSEEGIVESFFANPFGVIQEQEICEGLIDKFIHTLMDNSIPVGEIYTKLGIEGLEKSGPLDAASKLFDFIRR